MCVSGQSFGNISAVQKTFWASGRASAQLVGLFDGPSSHPQPPEPQGEVTVPQGVCHTWPLSRDCSIANGSFKLGKWEVEEK